jgi:ubiquitin carboxyl-terminal hydrolase 7
MSHKAGEYLQHDPIKLRFTTTNPTTGQPKAILKRSLNQSIAEIMAPIYASPTTTLILYEKLDVSIVELETKRSLKVIWTGIHNKEEGIHQFLLPKTNMVHDLADNLAKVVKLSIGGTSKIRIFEISKDGKTQKEFTGSEMIGNIPEPVELYAEVYCAYKHPEVFLTDHRKFHGKNSRLTTLTRSSVFSTSRKSCRGRMVCLSSLL